MALSQVIERIITPTVEGMGYELVRLTISGGHRKTLQVMAERKDGLNMSLDDCTHLSRAISAVMDVEDPIEGAYSLEVSSPGMERPLRKAAEWRRFIGRRASVNALALHGRQEVEIVAVDGEPGQERVRLRDGKGQEHQIALADVTDARLAFHWKP